jgi:hypothetical protein
MIKEIEAPSQEHQHAGAARQMQRLAESWYGVLLLSGLFTLAMIYHCIVPLNGILFTAGAEGHDWGETVWNLWFVNDAIFSGHNPYQTHLLYYPLGANLAHHPLSAGFFPITYLTKLFSRGDPLYPIYAYHLITFICFLLILACSYFLLRELLFTPFASAIAAFAYAFSDFYLQHGLHLNLLAGFFIPLTALYLVRAYKNPRSLNIICAAFVSAWSIHFTEFALYIYTGALLFSLLMLLFTEERRGLIEVLRTIGWQRVVWSLAVFVMVVTPFVANFTRGSIVKTVPLEISVYSANLAAFFVPGPQHGLLANIFGPLDAQITTGVGGLEAFLGFTLLVFGVVGLLRAKRKLVLCAGLSALAFYVLCLGPTLKVFGSDTKVSLPYALLMRVPPFGVSRTPVRFLSIATFFLMLVAAAGLSWTHCALVKRCGRHWAPALMLILFALTVAEAYTPTPRRHGFAPPEKLKEPVTGPVFNVPLNEFDGFAGLLQVFHHQPIATGAVARVSVENSERFRRLKQVYDQGGPGFCGRVADLGFQNIVVIPGDVMAPLELSNCRIRVIDLRTDDSWLAGFPDGIRSDEPQFHDYVYGTRVDFGTEAADKYLWYGWGGREPFSHWTVRGQATLTFSLPKIEASILRLRLAPFLVPGKLERQRVEVQLNDRPIASWTLSDQAARDIEIALPGSVLRNKNVLAFNLPDAAYPKSLNVSDDMRLLGVNVQWIEIVPKVTNDKLLADAVNGLALLIVHPSQ